MFQIMSKKEIEDRLKKMNIREEDKEKLREKLEPFLRGSFMTKSHVTDASWKDYLKDCEKNPDGLTRDVLQKYKEGIEKE